MKHLLSTAAALSMICLTLAVAQTGKPAAKKPQPQSTPKKASTTTVRKGTTSASKAGSKKAAAKKPSVTWRNRQTLPSPDRYREIQSALATRGYLAPENATGTWNQASIDALKRFQLEQNLESSGKINSLSLIALGLGPKREAVVMPPKPQLDPNGQ